MFARELLISNLRYYLFPCSCRLHLDLHSKILMGLAEVLADSRAKASSDEVEKLINKCPAVPINEGTEILTRRDSPELGSMVSKNLWP